ncbi:uncharacterized protein LOC133819904 [Humulus lupulus]|uniref:uncharacterized protein LOC133819904 n=1 Tax=Humulus lupulus TaxID=3486 RepID=UPI002B4056F3|nr:uncharacterized protein LOC133819904 [Humulus lupulus]
MDNQQLQKHDIHGKYVCRKCGWPYPKPHPSSKHRRAHKKICGTVEGYKLVDMEGSGHSTISDDDEDHNKTPTRQVFEESSFEKGNGRTMELTNRTEDVFSDAATEFSEGRLFAVTQDQADAGKSVTNVEKIVKSESNMNQSSDDGPIAESIKPLGSIIDGIQMQHSETPESTSNGSGGAPEYMEPSGCIASSVIDSSTDFQNEDLALNVNRNASVGELHTVKSDTQKDVSVESEKTNFIDDNVDGSSTLSRKGMHVKVEKDKYLDSSAVQFTILPTNVDAETAGVMSKSGEAVEKLEPVPAMPDGGLVQLQEKVTDVSTEDEHVNASNDTAKTTVDSAEGIDYMNSGDLIEKKGEVDANLLVLSVPDDIHVVDNPDLLLEDFKDHKALKVDHFSTLECKQTNDEEDDTKGPDVVKTGLDLLTDQSENNVVFVSDRHVLEDSVELNHSRSVPTVKDVPVEEEVNLSESKVKITESQRSDEKGTPSEVVMPLMDKTFSISSLGGEESYGICSETFQDNFYTNTKTVVSDEDLVIGSGNAGIVQAAHLSRVDDHEKVDKSDFSEDFSHGKEDDSTVSHVTVADSTGSKSENLVTNLHGGVDAGYEKIEFGKDDLTGDAGGHVATRVMDETVVASSNGPAKESFLKHSVVNPESAEKVSELQISLENNLQKGDDDGNYEKFEIRDYIGGDTCDAAAGQLKDVTGVDNCEGPTKESCAENAVVIPESINKSSELHVNRAASLQDGIDDNSFENDGIQKCVEDGFKSKEGPVEEHSSVQPKHKPESASHFQESHPVEESPVIGYADSSSAPTSGSVGVIVASDKLQETTEKKLDGNDGVQDSEDSNVKEPTADSPLHVKSSIGSSTGIDDISMKAFDATSVHGSEYFQEGIDKQHLAGSVTDLSVDSFSQTDSLEGNWGSVSVLSIQSDAQAVVDADSLPPSESQVAIGEKTDSNQLKPASEGQHPDKSDMFEAPSFLTLVEPGNGEKATLDEIQTGQNSQQPKSPASQAGWFPSITQVINESPGRKKNEDIIAKVTNWSTGKQQHTPLKNLLGKASVEARAKSPKRKENVAPDIQKGEKATTVNSILAPESPLGHAAADREIGKEWNSPARYPAEIKREKRKSRPYWAQFVCCSSSVH